jgi:diguanylate cyclase (GGDEF)-like protein
MTDDLTGLHNLRSFEGHLMTLVRDARETQSALALLVVDVDRLKTLNDQFGHLTGAEAVRTVGRIIGWRVPPDAIACRYGGDEFVIAVPGCTPFVVHRVADDLVERCMTPRRCSPGWFAAGTLSVSVGVVHPPRSPWRPPSHDVESGSAARAADAALYRAKACGRNRVCVA